MSTSLSDRCWIRSKGSFYLYEDTTSFIARRVARAAREYLEGLLPPFFSALLEYAHEAPYSWHTPGHNGGTAYTKSPVGRSFHQFFGENLLRTDLSVSVPELGSLQDHTGPLRYAEQRAAEIFGADQTFFVTNGTSMANRVIYQGLVSRDDVVAVDRNCHKSVLQGILLTGAIPIYLQAPRNQYGIGGPIGYEQFSRENLLRRLASTDPAGNARDRIALTTITNSTYDGLCYDMNLIRNQLVDVSAVLHYDEAWHAHAKFHEFYQGYYAMTKLTMNGEGSLVIAAQSTHKSLAALSQGSMIHVRNSSDRTLDPLCFNEALMMHSSTSPQYSIIASLDVATGMMSGKEGRALIHETLEEALRFRRAMFSVRAELASNDWWFTVWQPPGLDDVTEPRQADWLLQPNALWHGFGEIARNFVLLDPTKVTSLTPGLQSDGGLSNWGIPAAIVSRFLRERGMIVEKTGLYSFLVLFSMGVTKGKWASLVASLVHLKRLYDDHAPLRSAMPRLVEDHRDRYQHVGLYELCQSLHECYRRHRIIETMNRETTSLPPMVMKSADAYHCMVKGQVEGVDMDQLDGRIAAVPVVPYPPGIPLIMPGERFIDQPQGIVDHLRFLREHDAQFPGFEPLSKVFELLATARASVIWWSACGNLVEGTAPESALNLRLVDRPPPWLYRFHAPGTRTRALALKVQWIGL